MDFYTILDDLGGTESGNAYTPYAGRTSDGVWVEGTISIDFLNTHFGMFETATPMIKKAKSVESEGLELFFRWLVEQGKLQM